MKYRFAGNVEEITLVDKVVEPKKESLENIVDIHQLKITINNVKLENIKPNDNEDTAFSEINRTLAAAVFTPRIALSEVDSYASNINSTDTPVLIRLIYNKSVSNKKDSFYPLLLEKYGALIDSKFFDTKESDPIYPRNFGFFYLKYAKDYLPPSKFLLIGALEKSELIIDVQITSKIPFCQYCRAKSHKVQQCPLRPLQFSNKCKYCLTNTKKHNYLSCETVPLEDKLRAINSLPHEIIQRSLNTSNPFKQIPYELISNKDFPTGVLTEMQYRKLIEEVEERKRLESLLGDYITSQNGQPPALTLRRPPRYLEQAIN